MKNIISVIIAIIVFICSLSGANKLIHYMCSGFVNQDIKTLAVIGLWILSFSLIVGLSIFIAAIAKGLIDIILGND